MTGIEEEGFTCKATLPSGAETAFPISVKNESVQILCKRTAPTKVTLGNAEYEYLPRGTITIQTASDPFMLSYVEEYNPPAPLEVVAELKATIDMLADDVKKKADISAVDDKFKTLPIPDVAPITQLISGPACYIFPGIGNDVCGAGDFKTEGKVGVLASDVIKPFDGNEEYRIPALTNLGIASQGANRWVMGTLCCRR